MGLNSGLRSLIGELPRLAISKVVEEKLHDCGIHDDEALVEAITDHILSRSREKFTWDDDKYEDIKLSFDSSDFIGPLQDVERFLKDDLGAALTSAVDSCATIVFRKLRDD